MKRSKFSLSHTKLFSCDMGELIPCGMFEVLPGDTIQMATSALVRAAPLLAPVMHPVQVRIHHWFVPYRLIWGNFEDFITGGPDGLNASVYPTLSSGAGFAVGSLHDYLGVPTSVASLTVSALPTRAYQTIWNEWYRDQDLQTEAFVATTSGADTSSVILKNIDWEKDYFTSARPWEQKGPAVTIPLTGSAPVLGIGTHTKDFPVAAQAVFESNDTNPTYADAKLIGAASNDQRVYIQSKGGPTDKFPNIRADLTGISAVSMNVLREALALQRFEEARARFGSRYVEYLRYLGVRSSDARLQRPEYLGGGKNTIQFSEVLQQGVTTSGNTLGVGNMRGHGIAGVRSNRFRRYFEEHGLVMSLASVRPKTIYGNGLPRMWNRRTKEDFWQQELQHIGQQEILNKEVYGNHTSKDGIFGYQDRYDEYRRQESNVAGDFRTTLNFWHMSRDFAADPALNSTFVSCVPTERSFAVPSEDVIYIMANHSIQARRLVAATGKSYIF